MNTRILFAAALFALGATTANAGSLGDFEGTDLGPSVRSRAEVRAEAVEATQARFHAAVVPEFTAVIDTTPSTATRAEVRAAWWKELANERKQAKHIPDVTC